ncbi:MAG: plastocyanin [Pseudohongiellaceae bacterium]|jgi:plastocyanin
MQIRLNLIGGFLLSILGTYGNAQSLSVKLTDGEGNPIRDAVIEILLPDEMRSEYQPGADTIVDQLDKEFVPNMSTIVSGNSVSFPNSDDILHHVYSFSPSGSFYIPLYGKGTSEQYSQAFNSVGVIEIGCNLHDWMLAYIYVAETSLSGISDDDGLAILESVPSGTFELRIWHSRLKDNDIAVTHSFEFVDGEQTNLSYTLELKRDRRIRRAPSSNRTRYR